MLRVYQTCELKKATRCLNTNLVKELAKFLGRQVRKVNTLDGYLNWSECVDGEWHMFCQMLTLAYAKKIDAFDDGKYFKIPKACPMGPVEYKGPCAERKDPIEVIRERKVRYAERVKTKKIIPRSKFRRPQAEAVKKAMMV